MIHTQPVITDETVSIEDSLKILNLQIDQLYSHQRAVTDAAILTGKNASYSEGMSVFKSGVAFMLPWKDTLPLDEKSKRRDRDAPIVMITGNDQELEVYLINIHCENTAPGDIIKVDLVRGEVYSTIGLGIGHVTAAAPFDFDSAKVETPDIIRYRLRGAELDYINLEAFPSKSSANERVIVTYDHSQSKNVKSQLVLTPSGTSWVGELENIVENTSS